MKICIDPGHGGNDPGACANGLKEDVLNLDIAMRLKLDLEMQGYDVYITRSTDTYVDLLDRADAANLFKADLFVSIHNNANDSSSYNGTTVLYNSKAIMPAYSLARIMQEEIVQTIGTNPLRLEDRPGLVVLNSTWVPSVLAEVAVITNENDAAIISQEASRQAAADAITRAINKYYGFQW
jgi:N-acetylmuramoyl-L-alanine amidase